MAIFAYGEVDMRGYDLIKFWVLRHAFWVSSGVALAGTVAILSLQHNELSKASGPLATLLGFYVASLTLLHSQVRASVAEYNRLNEMFVSRAMVSLRRRIATSYAESRFNEWEDLFDFFEEIAFKVRLGIIEFQVAYQMFSYWILHYWFLLETRVNSRRDDPEDNDLYSGLEWLVRKFAILRVLTQGQRLAGREAINLLRRQAQTSRERFLGEERSLNDRRPDLER